MHKLYYTAMFYIAVNALCGDNNGGCSSFCLPSPNAKRFCLCDDQQRLLSDKMSCTGGNDKSIIFTMRSIIVISSNII